MEQPRRVHQAAGVAEPVKALHDFPEALQERVPIHVVIEDVLAGVASGRHMIERPFILHSEWTRHTLFGS